MAKIGLVLSGGMVKGAYQIGVLQALLKYIPAEEFHTVSASSIGAINAYAMLSGQLDYAKEIWETTKLEKNYTFVGSLLRKSFLDETIHKMSLEGKLLQQHLLIPLLNCKNRTLEYIDFCGKDREITEGYLNASIALPGFNKAIEVQGIKYFDGAMIDNIPILPFKEKEMDYIICVYFDNSDYIFENEHLNRKIIKINFTDHASLRSSLYAQNEHILQMIQEGYEKADAVCSRLFEKGYEDVDYILEQNDILQKYHAEKHIRISGDIIVNNMNKVVQKLIKRNII